MTGRARAATVGSALRGVRPMLALTLRRERRHGSAWYLLSAALVLGIAAGVIATFPTAGEREALAVSVNGNAGELFLIGPVVSTDPGGIGQWRSTGIAAILVGLASVFTMVRNTRAPEENGIGELLGSAAIGRAAPLAAASIAAVAGSVAAGIVVGAGFVALGAPVTGSVLVGAQVTLFGLLAAAVAGVTAQIMQTARGATGLAVVLVVAFFLVRGAGDVVGGGALWWSPFGWIAAVRPFARDAAGMLLPALALTGLLFAAAMLMASRRDVGAGLLPARRGPARAGGALRGPVTLALRLTRPTVVGGAAGGLVVGLLVGALSAAVDQQVHLALGGAAGGGSGLLSATLYLAPLVAAILGVHTTLRLRGEVTSGRAEIVLSRPVARSCWLTSHVVAGALVVLVVLVAFGAGLAAGQLGRDPGSSGSLVLAAALRAPAGWAFVALAALLLVIVPRVAAGVALGVLGAFEVLELAVEFRLAPPGSLTVSPVAMVPQLPCGDPHPWPTVVLLAVTGALVVVATRAIADRDIV